MIMYLRKFLKPRLRDDLNCFPDTNCESLWVELSIQKKERGVKFIILHRKTLVKMFLEKLVLGIDLAMAEGKSVIHAGDYNLNYFAKRDRSLLQAVISQYDIQPSNIVTTTRRTSSSLLVFEFIITNDYETGTIEDTILKTDHFATITVVKPVMLKSKTTNGKR